MQLSQKITDFLFNLQFPGVLPQDVEVLLPFTEKETRQACDSFYHKYYNDNKPRYCILGINPGRHGGGVTGIPFTDPIRLRSACDIENNWPKKQELSSIFVYDAIEAFGGPAAFYQQFYISSTSPLGFTKGGKNMNYYDDKQLETSVKPYAVESMEKQLSWGLHRTTAFCFGEGKNFAFLGRLNQEHSFFNKLVPLPHPRFIMQYKLKQKQEYIDRYLQAFTKL